MRQRKVAGTIFLCLAIALVYWPAMHGEFLLDDDLYLTKNRIIAAADGLYRIWFTTEAIDYWPVFNTSLWIEWRLWGMNPTGYHLTNLGLHYGGALLLWAILARLAIPGAFLAALLFAVHPVNVESVAWITQRKNLLAFFFFLLSIYFFVEEAKNGNSSRPRTAMRYGLSLLAFLLAMLSKGSVAVLPVVLLVIVAWTRPLTKRDFSRALPFFLISLVLVPVNVWFQARVMESGLRHAGFVERLLGAGGVVWFYLYKALLPIQLTFIYPQWQVRTDQLFWWLPLLATLGLTLLLWRFRRGWGRPFLFAWGYFCIALVPVLGFTDTGFMRSSLVADHYQHVALVAVVSLEAAAWATLRQRAPKSAHTALTVAAAALVGLLGLRTWQQSSLYARAETLYEATLAANPDAWLAHNNLGLLLAGKGRTREAIIHYRESVRRNPGFAEALNNLGNGLLQDGQFGEAVTAYRQALRSQPGFPGTHYNLGVALAASNEPEQALAAYEEALRLDPAHLEARSNLGTLLSELDRLPEAIEQYRQGLRFHPGSSVLRTNLGAALANAGKLQEAIDQFQHVLRTDPRDVDAREALEATLSVQRAAAGNTQAAEP